MISLTPFEEGLLLTLDEEAIYLASVILASTEQVTSEKFSTLCHHDPRLEDTVRTVLLLVCCAPNQQRPSHAPCPD